MGRGGGLGRLALSRKVGKLIEADGLLPSKKSARFRANCSMRYAEGQNL